MIIFERFIRITNFIIKIFCGYIFALIIKIFNKNNRNVWIISERGDDARDNAYFFYKYIREKHPEIVIYYVISSKSSDFVRIQNLGKWVEYGSFMHYVYYALSKVRISSSIWGGDLPLMSYFKKLRRFRNKKKKFIFLKHGIIKDYLPQHCYGQAYPNIYVCGAKPEYEYVKENFGYPNGVVQYLGLARFDNLYNLKVKRQILIMPTFRKWLQKMNIEEIKKSEFVYKWNEIINDPRLIYLLENNNLELIFYPHYVLQKYISVFTTSTSKIKVAKFCEYDVQTLLKDSLLLVTDFSSVFFDFAYMNKPVIYYQFDKDEYINKHYNFTKGYFSYDRDGFGDVVYDNNSLYKSIKHIIESNFIIDEKYKNRINNFFPIKDQCNCQRIYEKINLLIGEK